MLTAGKLYIYALDPKYQLSPQDPNFPRYIEGIVRGYRNSLLTSQNYNNLTQCENIDGRDPLRIESVSIH